MKRQIAKGLIVWLLFVIFFAVLWIFYSSAVLLAAAVIAAAIPFISLLFNRVSPQKFEAAIRIPSICSKNREFDIELNVKRTKKGISLGKIFAEICIDNEYTRKNVKITENFEIGSRQCSTVLTARSEFCGRIKVGISKIYVMDFFGFIPTKVSLEAYAKGAVVPDTCMTDVNELNILSLSDDGVDYRDNVKGNDFSEPYQYREYSAGDNLRAINWKLSTKIDKLMYREPGCPVSRSLLIYWDRGIPQENDNDIKMDVAAEVIFSMTQALCEAEFTYSLGWSYQKNLIEKEITSEDVLMDTISRLLVSEEISEIPLNKLTIYDRIFVISARNITDELPESVVLFDCSGNGADGKTIISFGEANYAEKLGKLGNYFLEY